MDIPPGLALPPVALHLLPRPGLPLRRLLMAGCARVRVAWPPMDQGGLQHVPVGCFRSRLG
eukprot:12094387-Alexandrium_andersonii.AAC.1